jgi:hypothetical protein
MATIRSLAALAVTLTLAGCVADPPPSPAGMIMPGADKTAAAFQFDQAVCLQHAFSQTGYGGPSAPGPTQLAPSAPAPSASDPTAPASGSGNQSGSETGVAAALAQPSADINFMQCMAARGDTVQVAQAGYPYPYPAPYPYPYPYPYGYSYGYPYPYSYPGGGIFFGGFGFQDRFHHGYFNRGGFHGGAFHGGAFHGGGFHGGGHR